MSDDSPGSAAAEEKKQGPAKRKLSARIAIGALKAAVVVGGLVVVVLAGSWLNVLPGGWRVRAAWGQRRAERQIAAFRAEAANVPEGSVVFLGSSTMEKMPMAKVYPGAPWLNRGIGAENMLGLLDRLDASLPVARPAGVVINAGANDFRADRREPVVVVARTAAVVDVVRARFPGVPIAIVEPIVQSSEEEDLVLQCEYASEALQVYARSNGFAYVRMNRPPLVSEEGRLRLEMTAADGRHPNEDAYRVIAKWIAEEGGEATAPLRASVSASK